jgi:hypothetical protein
MLWGAAEGRGRTKLFLLVNMVPCRVSKTFWSSKAQDDYFLYLLSLEGPNTKDDPISFQEYKNNPVFYIKKKILNPKQYCSSQQVVQLQ